MDELIDAGDRRMPPAPARPGGFIILTSGTTGLPKGAPRTKVSPLASAMIADRIPFPRKGSVVIVSPIFHSTGFGMWTVATALGNKTVLLRRFDAGYMSTGDMGRIDEHGLLHIDGRDDDMIVSGGENVYPLEIENLLAARPDIDDVSVVGVADEEFGKRLRAYIVPTPGATVNDAEIKAYVKANLARYKVPRDVVVLDELPRNATGKVLRRVLEEMD